MNDEGEGGSHPGLGIAADVVSEAVVEPAVLGAEGLVPERVAHVDGRQLQRPEAVLPPELRRLRREQIHGASPSPSLALSLARSVGVPRAYWRLFSDLVSGKKNFDLLVASWILLFTTQNGHGMGWPGVMVLVKANSKKKNNLILF